MSDKISLLCFDFVVLERFIVCFVLCIAIIIKIKKQVIDEKKKEDEEEGSHSSNNEEEQKISLLSKENLELQRLYQLLQRQLEEVHEDPQRYAMVYFNNNGLCLSGLTRKTQTIF